MGSPRAAIVIPAWNGWATTATCLEHLRPTLGVRDRVIVVDNGSTDATPQQLRKHTWLRVVTHPQNLGFAGGCNSGARLAAQLEAEYVVFLNSDTAPVGRWLDPLLAPLADRAVVAAGPRSNTVSGPQVVTSADYQSSPELKRFAKRWQDEHRDDVIELDRLVGFCLAVRTSAFWDVGGFDEGYGIGGFEDDDLCRKLRAAGGRLVMASGSYVHHDGHKTFDENDLDWFAVQEGNRARFEAGSSTTTTVSACLIVRDEADDIEACIASARLLADEVVVADTGSIDDTRAIAAAAGATVIDVRWTDDFAAARNAALAACSGDWILHLDADERLRLDDADAVRATLARPVDGHLVRIVNALGDADAPTYAEHRACRLFRRDRAHWQGRIHEQVVALPGQPALRLEPVDGATIDHHGYLAATMAARSKAERNLRLAERSAAEADPAERALALLHLGRSLGTAGRHADAVRAFDEAMALDQRPGLLRPVLRQAVESLLELDRPDRASELVVRLRSISESQSVADVLAAAVEGKAGRHDEALALLAALGEGAVADDDGLGYDATAVLRLRARSLAALGRHVEACDALFAVLATGQAADAVWPLALDALRSSGRPAADALTALPAGDAAIPVLGVLLQLDLDVASVLAEALFVAEGATPRALALAEVLGPKLAVADALAWSQRLRANGRPERCPVVQLAQRPLADPLDRVVAAATAHAAFADDRALPVLRGVAATVDPGAFGDVLVIVGGLCPELLGEVVQSAATSVLRCEAMADALRSLGADEQADAVAAHGRAMISA